MPQPKSLISRVLSQYGIKQLQSSYRVRFGGVVGKIALIALAIVGGQVAVIERLTRENSILLLSLALFLFGIFIVSAIIWFAHRHPEATLEGAELLAYQHQLAARNEPDIPPGDPKPDPLQIEASGSIRSSAQLREKEGVRS